MAKQPAYDYAHEKFWQAIDTLATSDGSIQERLEWAAMILIRLQPGQDLPKAHREEFEAILHNLTKEPAVGDEGAIRATTRKLTAEEGKSIASRILHIYTELHGGI